MYQGQTEYPSLHLMVTDNYRFQEGKLVITDLDAVMQKVAAWLHKNLEGSHDN
jgi:hypothetical protein